VKYDPLLRPILEPLTPILNSLFQTVPVTEQGNVLNPMHPINRMSGLRAGQRFAVPTVQLLAAAMVQLGQKQPAVRQLWATVYEDHLTWNEQEILCWRIDYTDADQKTTARTWVRQADDRVLQQEASHQGLTLVLVRDAKKPGRNP
jgi:hypothetical protein